MASINEMAEKNILEFEARQRHVEELLGQARKGIAARPERDDARLDIKRLAKEHERLSELLDQLKRAGPESSLDEQIAQSGPMAVWDILAQDLERLVERLAGRSVR